MSPTVPKTQGALPLPSPPGVTTVIPTQGSRSFPAARSLFKMHLVFPAAGAPGSCTLSAGDPGFPGCPQIPHGLHVLGGAWCTSGQSHLLESGSGVRV